MNCQIDAADGADAAQDDPGFEVIAEHAAPEPGALFDDLAELPGLTGAMLVTLGEAKIKTLDDLADLAGDDLNDPNEGVLREFGLSEADANEIIMAARAHWFDDDPSPATEDGAGDPSAAG